MLSSLHRGLYVSSLPPRISFSFLKQHHHERKLALAWLQLLIPQYITSSIELQSGIVGLLNIKLTLHCLLCFAFLIYLQSGTVSPLRPKLTLLCLLCSISLTDLQAGIIGLLHPPLTLSCVLCSVSSLRGFALCCALCNLSSTLAFLSPCFAFFALPNRLLYR